MGSLSDADREVPAPAWLKGLAFTPYSMVMGVGVTALPFLLAKQNVSVAEIASIGSLLGTPLVFGFVLKPLLDVGLSRKVYSWSLAGVAALSSALGVGLLQPHHLHAATMLLLASSLAAVLYWGAAGGWIATDVKTEDCGTVSAWQGIANGAVATLAIAALLWLMDRVQWTAATFGVLTGLLVMVGALPLLFLPKAGPSQFRFSEVFSTTLQAVWQSTRERRNLVGLALLLSPVGAAAASNLQTGFGKDFKTSDSLVIEVTLATAIITPLASLLGGWLADRYVHAKLYLALGALTGIVCLVTAATAHTPYAYVVSTVAYDTISGLSYTVYGALALDLAVGSSVASTQLGMLGAAMNASVVYMTAVDGWGYKLGGIGGLYAVEGAASLLSAIVWFVLLRAPRGKT